MKTNIKMLDNHLVYNQLNDPLNACLFTVNIKLDLHIFFHKMIDDVQVSFRNNHVVIKIDDMPLLLFRCEH